MKESISTSIKTHYADLFKKFGENPESLGWTKSRQSIRFNIVTQIGKMHDASVLDVGCGFGDFYGYLKYKKIKTKYVGIDINGMFIDLAKSRYPNGNFQVRDIQKDKFSKKFDWVIAIGTTNHASTYPHLKSLLKEMLSICKKGVVMDFISTYVDFKEKKIFYTSPEIILKYSKSLTKRVVLRHDYMPYEFCIYLYKNDTKNNKNVFSEYYKQLPAELRNDLPIKKNNFLHNRDNLNKL